MKKYELIDFDEKSLPDVNLNENQKTKIKNSLNYTLNKFHLFNPNIKIDISQLKTDEIQTLLDSSKYKNKHGIKNANLLKRFVLEAIEKDINLNSKDILYKKFLQAGAGSEYSGPPTFLKYRGTFYYQLYIINDGLIIYSLDDYFRVINKNIIKINEIKSVQLSNKDFDNLKLDNTNLILEIDPDTSHCFSSYFFVDENPKDTSALKEIKDILLNLGISEYKPKKFSLPIVIYIILVIIIVLVFGSNVLKSLL